MSALETPTTSRPVRLGVVSFVNTLPLIDGLDDLADVELAYSVPSLLLDTLIADEVELALCSSIDYQRSTEPLVVVPAGLLGCDGPTLTVRLYSSRPIEAIGEVHCDTDSHTSVVLLQILLRELYGVTPRLIDYDARERAGENRPVDDPVAMMLIGDKVVTESPDPDRYPFQLDLGDAWVEHTGLPFVFAMWLAKRAADPSRLGLAAAVLDRQRRHNRERLDRIVHHRAIPRRWPRELAADYLKDKLAFEWTAHREAGLELFYDKAHEHGLIDQRRPLELMHP